MTSKAGHDTSVQRLYWAAAALAALTLPAFLVDLRVVEYPPGEFVPGDIRRIFGWAEVFAHGVGVAVIALTILVLDVERRRYIPRVMASAYLAGLLANLGKMLIARVRPRYFDFQGGVADTFLGWLPLVYDPGPGFEPGFAIQSFPSGHTATAVGMAVGMSYVYPRGRWLFFLFAACAAAQRMDVRAHYLSDVLAASAVGMLAAGWIFDPRVFGRWFDRLERQRREVSP
jgi:membrane-associated phospholipid phosphatase